MALIEINSSKKNKSDDVAAGVVIGAAIILAVLWLAIPAKSPHQDKVTLPSKEE